MVISCLFVQAAKGCDMTICNGSPASQGLYYAKILGEIDGIVIGVQILDSINAPQKKIGDNRPIVKLAITGIRYT